MKAKFVARSYAYRILTSIIFGNVTVVQIFGGFATIFILLALLRNNSPTEITSYRGIKLDLKDIDKEAIDTILIENANGNYYIAFEIPKGSSVFRRLKSGVRLFKSANETNTIHTTTKPDNLEPNPAIQMTGKAINFTTKPVYPLPVYTNAYYINNERVCHTDANLTFLVVVHSATGHFSRRISIRETWANKKLFKNHEFRIVFLLGKPEMDSTQILIEHENSLYHDIVQGNFLDTYHNLTHKAVLGVRWVMEYCRNTKFIVKVDDDVFLNVFQLIHDTETIYSNKSKAIYCGVRNVNTSRIERKGKWKVEDHYFRNMSFYPVKYCNGFFALMTSDMFPALFEAAKQTPFFWIDDVYLFGLLTERIGGVKFTGLTNLNLNEGRAVECFETKEKKCDLLVSTARTEGVMDTLWGNAIAHYKDLAKKYSRDELF